MSKRVRLEGVKEYCTLFMDCCIFTMWKLRTMHTVLCTRCGHISSVQYCMHGLQYVHSMHAAL